MRASRDLEESVVRRCGLAALRAGRARPRARGASGSPANDSEPGVEGARVCSADGDIDEATHRRIELAVRIVAGTRHEPFFTEDAHMRAANRHAHRVPE